MELNRKQDKYTYNLKVYAVGGVVRDKILGLPSDDYDWVVIGATPEEMFQRGFLPVGGKFPVFLHPITKEEYALARTEYKSGLGYHGFTFYARPDVTLIQDLYRRDLTINSIACQLNGCIVDPLGGVNDLKSKVFRHTSPAFVEDPIRVLRLARFASRFNDFVVSKETMKLCEYITQKGEMNSLVPERVWKELSRGLMNKYPSRMWNVLQSCNAIPCIIPEIRNDIDLINKELDTAAKIGVSLPSRYALLCRHIKENHELNILNKRLRVPRKCATYARLLPSLLRNLQENTAESYLRSVEQCDAIRNPHQFIELLMGLEAVGPINRSAWKSRLKSISTMNTLNIVNQCGKDPICIKNGLRSKRLECIRESINRGQ